MVAFAEFDNRGVRLSRRTGIQNLRIQDRRLNHSAEADTDAVPSRRQVAKLESTVAIRFRCQSLGRRPKAIARNQLDLNALRWLAIGRESDTAEREQILVLSRPSLLRKPYTRYRSPFLNAYPQSPPPMPVVTSTVAS